MNTRTLCTTITAAAAGTVLLAGCGSPGRATPAAAAHAAARPSGHATSTPTDSAPSAVDAGAIYSLTASQVQAAVQGVAGGGSAFTQTSDDLFMKQAGTSQRFFDSTTAGYELELDVLPDGKPDASATTYSAMLSYTSADLSQVTHSTPSIGNQADEYTGVAQAKDNAILGVDAISFREGATVGMVFLASGDGVAHTDAGEAIARALAEHVSSVTYPPGPCGSELCLARFEGTTDSTVVQFDVLTSGWYETSHFEYAVSSGQSCELDSWSYRGPQGSVATGDPETDLTIARSASGEQDYLKAGHYVVQFSTTGCFWRIMVQPTSSPFG